VCHRQSVGTARRVPAAGRVFFPASPWLTNTIVRESLPGGQLSQASANRIRVNTEGLADGTLSAMAEGVGFKGRIMTLLPFIQGVEKLFFDVKMFNVHDAISIEASKKLKLFF
jgi:hypothetical protein